MLHEYQDETLGNTAFIMALICSIRHSQRVLAVYSPSTFLPQIGLGYDSRPEEGCQGTQLQYMLPLKFLHCPYIAGSPNYSLHYKPIVYPSDVFPCQWNLAHRLVPSTS